MNNVASCSRNVTTDLLQAEMMETLLISEMKKKLRETPIVTTRWSHIMSVKEIDQQSVNSFRPCVVSIGITHAGNPSVNDFQPLKWVYMKSLLSRSYLNYSPTIVSATDKSEDEALEDCVRAIAGHKAVARLYYETEAESASFMEVLILDSCFILELLIRHYTLSELYMSRLLPNLLVKATENHALDPVLRFHWIVLAIRRDLVLLGNQIPFEVLQSVLSKITRRSSSLPHNFLEQMATLFFKPSHLKIPRVPVIEQNLHRIHLLNLVANIYRPTAEIMVVAPPTTGRRCFLLNATSLNEIGVKFYNHYNASSLLDVNFTAGVFKIPTLHISKWSDSFFRNIIAYEPSCLNRKPYMASYIELMSQLMVGPEDVQLLKRCGILINDLGSDSEIIVMLSKIRCQFDQSSYFYYQNLCNEVDSYGNTSRTKYTTQLKYRKLKNPWILTIMVCAMIVTVGIVIQTLYVGKTYSQRKR